MCRCRHRLSRCQFQYMAILSSQGRMLFGLLQPTPIVQMSSVQIISVRAQAVVWRSVTDTACAGVGFGTGYTVITRVQCYSGLLQPTPIVQMSSVQTLASAQSVLFGVPLQTPPEQVSAFSTWHTVITGCSVIRIAAADSNRAHVIGANHQRQSTVLLFGVPLQIPPAQVSLSVHGYHRHHRVRCYQDCCNRFQPCTRHRCKYQHQCRVCCWAFRCRHRLRICLISVHAMPSSQTRVLLVNWQMFPAAAVVCTQVSVVTVPVNYALNCPCNAGNWGYGQGSLRDHQALLRFEVLNP